MSSRSKSASKRASKVLDRAGPLAESEPRAANPVGTDYSTGMDSVAIFNPEGEKIDPVMGNLIMSPAQAAYGRKFAPEIEKEEKFDPTEGFAAENYQKLIEEAAATLTDPFWKEILLKGAKGKWPKQISFWKGTMRYSNVRKNTSKEIYFSINEARASVAVRMTAFLRQWLAIESPNDQKTFFPQREEIEKPEISFEEEEIHTNPNTMQDVTERRVVAAQLKESRAVLPEMVILTSAFGVMSFEELTKQAVVTVMIPSNKVESGTVNDPRMGVLHEHECATCMKDINHCPGHLGMIVFTIPILHPLFIKEIIQCLMCIRIGCSNGLKLTPDQITSLMSYSGMNRLTHAAEMAVKNSSCSCDNCKKPIVEGEMESTLDRVNFNIPLSEERFAVVFYINKVSQEYIMPISEVEARLASLTKEDAEILGFSSGMHPVNFIMKALPVIPPNVRPPTFVKGTMHDEHLTAMYIEIVRLNNRLAEASLSNSERKIEYAEFKKRVFWFMDNSSNNWAQGHSAAYKSIKQRISGKTELRAHAMGKRVLHAARSVIGPDLQIEFGQISVSRTLAETLTTPEVVMTYNRVALQKRLLTGSIVRVTDGDGPHKGVDRIVTAEMRKEHLLQVGDVVRRKIEDGDIVFGNRQPTLHSFGMRAFYVKIREAKTIGVNLQDTQAFNADFDGDEMNLHVPQTLEGYAEAMSVAAATECIMNAQNDAPIAGNKLDTVTAFARMTMFNNTMEIDEFTDLVDNLSEPISLLDLERRARSFGLPLYCTRVLFSSLLPPDFYYRGKDVVIERGILISGMLTESNVGSSSRSITHFIFKKYGRDRALQWLTDSQRLANMWYRDRGATFGMSECIAKDPAAKQKVVDTAIAEAKLKIAALGPAPDPRVDPLGAQRHEDQIKEYLKLESKIGESIADLYEKDNALFLMFKSEAKGKATNVSSITSLIGQQSLRNQRLRPERVGGRTLSYFEPDDPDISSNGFIQNSFLSGMNPTEFFMHMSAGREGVVDTNNTTASVGAMNHRLIKSLEDLRVENDGSVRNASSVIIQMLYGYDGYGGHELMRTKNIPGSGEEEIATFLDIGDMANTLNARAEQYYLLGELEGTIANPAFAGGQKDITKSKIRMTKYEVARVAGTRAEQLANGAPALIEPIARSDSKPLNAVDIALQEMRAGVLPMKVRRVYPDGSIEDFDIRDMHIPFFDSLKPVYGNKQVDKNTIMIDVENEKENE